MLCAGRSCCSPPFGHCVEGDSGTAVLLRACVCALLRPQWRTSAARAAFLAAAVRLCPCFAHYGVAVLMRACARSAPAVAHIRGTDGKWWRFDDEAVTCMGDSPMGHPSDHGSAPTSGARGARGELDSLAWLHSPAQSLSSAPFVASSLSVIASAPRSLTAPQRASARSSLFAHAQLRWQS